MISIKRIAFFVILATSLHSNVNASEDKVLAKYKHGEIKESEILEQVRGQFDNNPELKGKKISDLDPAIQEMIVNQYVSSKVIEKEAESLNIQNSEEFKKRLEDSKRVLLQSEYIESQLKKVLTDSVMDEKYEQMVNSLKGKKEVKISHILLKSQDAAKGIIAKIKKGEKFSEIAKKHSEDANSNKSGGQIKNYLRQGVGNPKELDEKIFTMKKGEVSDVIKTDFGYHIVKIDDVRDIKVPSKEEAKNQLFAEVRSQEFAKILEGLNKKYEVKVMVNSDKAKVEPTQSLEEKKSK